MTESNEINKIFTLTRKVGKLFGVDKKYPWDNVNINRNSVITLTVYFVLYLCSSAFFMFEADTFSEYSASFYIAFTGSGAVVNLALLLWKSQEVHDLMSNFEKTYEKRSDNPNSRHIYEEMNEKIEYMTWKFYVGLVIITTSGATFPNLIISYYQYFVSDLRTDAFVLPYSTVLPFDYRNPYTYLIAFMIQTTAYYFIMIGCVYNMSFHVGLSYVIQAFARDIKQELHSLTAVNAVQENYRKSQELISEFVRIHSKMKQFVADFSDIYSFVFTGCLSWCLITICSVLLMVQLELVTGNGNILIWIQPITFLFWSFGKAMILCDNAQNVTNQFEDLNYSIYQMDWWSFPLRIKRLLPMLLMNSQEPVTVRSFGNVECTRPTFKAIANGGISYFLTLRQFT